MRFSVASRQRLAICLVAGLAAGLSLARTACRQAVAEIAAERPADVLSPDVGPRQPSLHADVYRRLAVPVKLDFHQAAVGKVLRRLADSTGVDIELVDDSMAGTAKDFEGRITLMGRKPVSLQMAIRLAVRSCRRLLSYAGRQGSSDCQAGTRRQINTYSRHTICGARRLHHSVRTRFIEQVRREIAADDWGRADGPWIVPSRSVLAVDVYHKPEVQRQINALWQREISARTSPPPTISNRRRQPLR